MNSPSNNNSFSWKSSAREFAVKFMFQFFLKENQELLEQFKSDQDTLEDSVLSFLESYETPDEEHPKNLMTPEGKHFALALIKSIFQNFENYEQTISKHLKSNWKLSNIEKIDHATLLVGLSEITKKETPYQVVISELVEVAKTYGPAESGPFINGVLDAIAKNNS